MTGERLISSRMTNERMNSASDTFRDSVVQVTRTGRALNFVCLFSEQSVKNVWNYKVNSQWRTSHDAPHETSSPSHYGRNDVSTVM